MRCQNCGYNNVNDAIYCKNCGTKLEQPLPERAETHGGAEKFSSGWWVKIAVIIIATVIIVGAVAFFLVKHINADEASQPETREPVEPAETEPAESEPAKFFDGDSRDEEGIHTYEYVLADCSWEEAFARAKKAGGYLAHINSRQEFSYIVGELENEGYHKMQFFIGGRRDPGMTDYYWVNDNDTTYGEALNDSMGDWFWMKDEPSYASEGTEERYMNIFYYRGESRWVGNDTVQKPVDIVPEFRGKVGYIIEYD